MAGRGQGAGVTYAQFLATKHRAAPTHGHHVDPGDIHPRLFGFQAHVTRWAIQRGRAAVWADTGLGKTAIQLEWARLSADRSLIAAPLAVCQQTVREAEQLGITARYVRSDGDAQGPGVWVTNYEMLDRFDPAGFGAAVLDEASILKQSDGKTRTRIIGWFAGVDRRLLATATPAPNDPEELTNQAECLGVMTRREMLASYFVHDSDGWRLKGHARGPMFQWMATWAVALRTPSDLGYPDDGYLLPPLDITADTVAVDGLDSGDGLFPSLGGVGGRAAMRRQTLDARVERAAQLVAAEPGEPWLLWCGLNDEAEQLAKLIPDAVNVHGGWSPEDKATAFLDFADGKIQHLITKPSIAAMGLNFQHCARQAFVGINDSYEAYYQAIRRSWRFGQARPVSVHVVVSDLETQIVANIRRKEQEAAAMTAELVTHMQAAGQTSAEPAADAGYGQGEETGDGWRLLLGDSCERLAELADDSVGLSVYSPPFASLFTYSPTSRDLGNSASRAEFFAHYRYIIEENLRVTMPGRVAAVHVQQVATTKASHGVQKLTDFRGEVIRAYEAAGWWYVREVTVDKDPQALRHGQRVLTPTGWVAIENLSVGDQVTGSDGTATKVEGVWPQGCGDILRVTFSDGAEVDCDAAHKWTVRGLGARATGGQWQTLTTAELAAVGLYSPIGRRRWEVPIVEPVQFDPQPDLPLSPYVMGAILGDGNVTQRASVAMHTQRAVAARVGSLLPDGHTIREQAGTAKGDDTATFHIGHPGWHRNDVLQALRDLGMQGLRAWEKRIPAAYLTSSPEDRLELLRGLLDTDGTVKKNGAVVFCTSSERLARDVVSLVQSLGGLGRLRVETHRPYRHAGRDRVGRPLWSVSIALDGVLFTLPGKVSRLTRRRRWHREVVSIEMVGRDDRTCITVAADDGLFVTEGHVVTHNSQAIRTKAHNLMFATKNKDSSRSWPALADYLLIFQKPGDNPIPVATDVTNDEWILWARPVWYDIPETDTLNVAEGRESADERHICPLQLPLIRRAVRLWSNPGELVLSPFAGIGSEGFEAVKLGRRFVGCELKPSYWRTAVRNLRRAERDASAPILFE